MDFQAKKLEILRLVLDTKNPNILDSIRMLFKKEVEKDFWNTLSEDQKNEILKGIEEVEKGEIVDYEELMKKHRK